MSHLKYKMLYLSCSEFGKSENVQLFNISYRKKFTIMIWTITNMTLSLQEPKKVLRYAILLLKQQMIKKNYPSEYYYIPFL